MIAAPRAPMESAAKRASARAASRSVGQTRKTQSVTRVTSGLVAVGETATTAFSPLASASP